MVILFIKISCELRFRSVQLMICCIRIGTKHTGTYLISQSQIDHDISEFQCGLTYSQHGSKLLFCASRSVRMDPHFRQSINYRKYEFSSFPSKSNRSLYYFPILLQRFHEILNLRRMIIYDRVHVKINSYVKCDDN